MGLCAVLGSRIVRLLWTARHASLREPLNLDHSLKIEAKRSEARFLFFAAGKNGATTKNNCPFYRAVIFCSVLLLPNRFLGGDT